MELWALSTFTVKSDREKICDSETRTTDVCFYSEWFFLDYFLAENVLESVVKLAWKPLKTRSKLVLAILRQISLFWVVTVCVLVFSVSLFLLY